MNKLFVSILILFFSVSSFAQALSYKIEQDSIFTKSKKMRYDLTIRYPQIIKPATTGQRGFNKYVDKMMNNAEDTFKMWMKDWEIPEHFKKDLTMNSYYDLNYSMEYSSDKTISFLFYEESYFLGAAHPNHYNFSVNYDLENNKTLKMSDIFTGNYLKTISEICIKEITKQMSEYDSTTTEPDEWLVRGAGPTEDNYKVFNFNETELIITFPTYQVASYADGPKEVIIPLAVLKDYIRKDGVLSQIKN